MILIDPIPAFKDNYIWCLYDDQSNLAYIVDPGDADPVFSTLEKNNRQLAGILLTHHHYDHIGGVSALLARQPVPVYGPHNPAIPHVTFPVSEGDKCDVLGVTFTVLSIPGHTLDHIAFYADQGFSSPVLFCGDTLFTGGCGRLFEGSAKQLYHSLQKLAALPDNTQIYCAHEYTLANLAFAEVVEPKNRQIRQRIKKESAKRQQNKSTIPGNLALEKATNPFLRCHIGSVIHSATQKKGSPCRDAVDVFASLRHWKDKW